MPRLTDRPLLFFRVACALALIVGVAPSSGCREMAGKKKNKSPHAKADDEDEKTDKKADSKDGKSKGEKPKGEESKSDAAPK